MSRHLVHLRWASTAMLQEATEHYGTERLGEALETRTEEELHRFVADGLKLVRVCKEELDRR